MLAQISSRQLTEWMAFSILEPFGFDIDMLPAGIISASIYNSRRTKESQRYFEPSDFMPNVKKRNRPTQGEFYANIKSLILLNKEK